MAMRKQPERRYASVRELSEDIGRYLEGLPVRARADSLLYRAGRRVARYRAPLVASAATLAVALVAVATTLMLADRVRPGGDVTAAEGVMVQRRVRAGHDSSATAVFPDGQKLSTLLPETSDIALYDVSSGELTALTRGADWTNVMGGSSLPSPDGTRVAYGWTRDSGFNYELRVIGVDGTGDRLLSAESVSPQAWTPDGKAILAYAVAEDGTGSIALVSVADGSVRRLKNIAGAPHRVSISPAGGSIAYDAPSLGDQRHRDIFLLQLDGGGDAPLVADRSNDFAPLWTGSPHGIVFLSDRSAAGISLWWVAVVDGAVSGEPILVVPDMDMAWPIGLTADDTLFFSRRVDGSNVHVAGIDLETGEQLAAPLQVSVLNDGDNLQPDWSPDGSRLAYVTTRSNLLLLESEADRLSILDVETGEVRTLTPDLPFFRSPRWAPDGRSLIVRSWDKEGVGGLYRIDATTAAVETVVQSREFFPASPRWSLDGSGIYYQIRKSRVMFCPLGGEPREIRRLSEMSFHYFELSPAGDILALMYGEEDAKGLLLVPVDGSAPTRLTRWQRENRWGGLVGWSPDGEGLIFIHSSYEPNWQSVLKYLPVEGGVARTLDLDLEGKANFRLHPEGDRIAFTSGFTKNEIWRLENFLPGNAQQRR